MRNAMLALAISLASTLAPLAAQAHALLQQSQPVPNGHLKPGQLTANLRYNTRIDALRSKLTLTAPNGTTTRLTITAGATPDTITAPLTLTPGAYTLRWQVLATDGHITRGSIPFTVDAH